MNCSCHLAPSFIETDDVVDPSWPIIIGRDEAYAMIKQYKRENRHTSLKSLHQRLKHPESPMKHLPKKSKPKLATFFFLNIFVGLLAISTCILVYKDNQNATLGLEEWQTLKFHKDYFEVGAYPMGGMLTSLAGATLDVTLIFIFLFGFTCSCVYYRHYTRLALISLLVTITAFVVLFATDTRASDYLRRYFKIVLEFEYKSGEMHRAKSGQMFLDNIQRGMQCCGYNSWQDWKTSNWLPSPLNELMLPSTCCINLSANSCSILDERHKVGCSEVLFQYAGRWRMFAKVCLFVKIASLIICILLGTQLYKEHALEIERRLLLAQRRKFIQRSYPVTSKSPSIGESAFDSTSNNGRWKTVRDRLPQYRFHKISNASNVEINLSGTM